MYAKSLSPPVKKDLTPVTPVIVDKTAAIVDNNAVLPIKIDSLSEPDLTSSNVEGK